MFLLRLVKNDMLIDGSNKFGHIVKNGARYYCSLPVCQKSKIECEHARLHAFSVLWICICDCICVLFIRFVANNIRSRFTETRICPGFSDGTTVFSFKKANSSRKSDAPDNYFSVPKGTSDDPLQRAVLKYSFATDQFHCYDCTKQVSCQHKCNLTANTALLFRNNLRKLQPDSHLYPLAVGRPSTLCIVTDAQHEKMIKRCNNSYEQNCAPVTACTLCRSKCICKHTCKVCEKDLSAQIKTVCILLAYVTILLLFHFFFFFFFFFS